MAAFTAHDLTELAELLKRNPSAANLDTARRAVKPPKQAKPKTPKPQPTEREKLLARMDKAIKLNDELVALRVESYNMKTRQPGDPEPSIRRQAVIGTEIVYKYTDINETLRSLLPKVREVLSSLPDPEKAAL